MARRKIMGRVIDQARQKELRANLSALLLSLRARIRKRTYISSERKEKHRIVRQSVSLTRERKRSKGARGARALSLGSHLLCCGGGHGTIRRWWWRRGPFDRLRLRLRHWRLLLQANHSTSELTESDLRRVNRDTERCGAEDYSFCVFVDRHIRVLKLLPRYYVHAVYRESRA